MAHFRIQVVEMVNTAVQRGSQTYTNLFTPRNFIISRHAQTASGNTCDDVSLKAVSKTVQHRDTYLSATNVSTKSYVEYQYRSSTENELVYDATH